MKQLIVPTVNFNMDLKILNELGFRLDRIYPSDNPKIAELSGNGIHLKLDRSSTSAQVMDLIIEQNGIVDLNEFPAQNLSDIEEFKSSDLIIPEATSKFEVRRLKDSDPWVIGRAGMQYRDLIPDRLGGNIIASHIRIPNGGPVPDMVHFHTVGFQLIFCYKGWVKLVYEDQGPPFILKAGDCVTQPPEIRHRVLEASDDLQVIEIAVPSDHMTTIDHELELPNDNINPDRVFHGQKFCRHQAEKAEWNPWLINSFIFRDSGIHSSTNGEASVHVIKCPAPSENGDWINHDSDILFGFVLEGKAELLSESRPNEAIKTGDAFLIPADFSYSFSVSDSIEIVEVRLSGNYQASGE